MCHAKRMPSAPIVLVPGFWLGAWAWDEVAEALRAEVEHFARCIEQGEAPISSGRDGLALVRILEAAEESIARQGQAVQLGGVPVGTVS